MFRLHFAYMSPYQVLEYHMEFLETFGCIWSSKEVIRVIFGRALPGATSRNDYMKSLYTTSRSDFPRATARSCSRFYVRRHTYLTLERPPRATCRSRSRCSERPTKVAPSPERPAQSDYLKSLQPERPAQVARVLTGRDTKKRRERPPGSDYARSLCVFDWTIFMLFQGPFGHLFYCF